MKIKWFRGKKTSFSEINKNQESKKKDSKNVEKEKKSQGIKLQKREKVLKTWIT